jgi:hypothetical protein
VECGARGKYGKNVMTFKGLTVTEGGRLQCKIRLKEKKA